MAAKADKAVCVVVVQVGASAAVQVASADVPVAWADLPACKVADKKESAEAL